MSPRHGALLSLLLGLAPSALGASGASAQAPIVRGSSSVVTFAGYLGDGFDPVPTSGRLDSRAWQPFGTGVPTTPFGGTCTAGVCARGQMTALTAAPGGAGYYELVSSSFFGQGLAMLASDSALAPGGVHLRLINADAAAILTHATLEVQWGRRIGLVSGSSPPESLAITADDCGAHGVSYPLMLGTDATFTSTGTVHYEGHDATFSLDLRPALVTPGGLVCITFTIGGPARVRDIVVIEQVTITVPAASCGDGFVDAPEEVCEPTAGMGACACDGSCHFPSASCVDGDANPCTQGGCVHGACVAMPVTGMAGCCTTDVDCTAGTCMLSSCGPDGTCTTPTHDPSCLGDASVPPDAGSTSDAGTAIDASLRIDSGSNTGDAALDASGLRAAPGIGFGGGGGCRCRASARGEAGGAWVLLAWAAVTIRRRRRRA